MEQLLFQADNLLADVRAHPHNRIGTAEFGRSARALRETWASLREDVGRWNIISATTLDAVDKEIASLGLLSQRRPLTTEVVSCLSHLSQVIERDLLPSWARTIWYEFWEDYGRLDRSEKEYIDEAFRAFENECYRAAIVLGWCATVARLHRAIMTGRNLRKFNSACVELAKSKKPPWPFRGWTDQFTVATVADLQEISDSKVLVVLQAMGILDRTQHEALRSCLDRRNLCAHPGAASAATHTCLSFFHDVFANVFQNPRLQLLRRQSQMS